ncbi:hypothetical protein DENSPDRAFT_778768, partial [Dentipellis sp. KUC8613]
SVLMYNCNLLPLSHILKCVYFSCRMFWWIKKLFEDTGRFEKPRCNTRGISSVSSPFNLEYLLELALHRPLWL